MQDKLKESISKSEHLVELFAEREGAAIFLKWAGIPRRNFFVQEDTHPKELDSFQGIYFQLSCTVPYSPYGTAVAHFFEKTFMGTIF